MNLTQLLNEQAAVILATASEALARSHLKHYEAAGKSEIQQYLQTLHDLTRQSVQTRNLEPMRAYMTRVAHERFSAGFDIQEVQTAVNILEETIWQQVIRELPPSELGTALGLISTVLGAGKDILAQSYVSLASQTKAPSLNLLALFNGTNEP